MSDNLDWKDGPFNFGPDDNEDDEDDDLGPDECCLLSGQPHLEHWYGEDMDEG